MATGYLAGGTCHRTPEAAGAAMCYQMAGVSSAGPVACTGVAVEGDQVTMQFTVAGGQSSASSLVVPLQPCQTLGGADVWPVVGAAFVALCMIWAGRRIVGLFDRDSS